MPFCTMPVLFAATGSANRKASLAAALSGVLPPCSNFFISVNVLASLRESSHPPISSSSATRSPPFSESLTPRALLHVQKPDDE